MYDIYQKLLDKHGLKNSDISRATGISNMTLSDWKRGVSTPKHDKLKKIADYFGVTVDYLMTGKEEAPPEPQLTARDKRDIAKDVDSIMEKLSNKEYGPAAFNGEELTEASAELFKEELEIALKRLKLINKEKYNPNKNKK